MPRHVCDLSGCDVFLLAEQGHRGALRERLRREIMTVDGIEYENTTGKLREMSDLIGTGHMQMRLPYHIGIWTAMISGYCSLPLVCMPVGRTKRSACASCPVARVR